MDEQLSPRIVERLEQLSRNIRVSPEMDEEVYREIMGHMRDKLLGYLDGCEKLSEDDALLLVERHFGNTATVQNLLQEVHSVPNRWGKRLMGVALLAFWVATPSAACGALAWSSSSTLPLSTLVLYLVSLLLKLGAVFIMCYVLCQWQRQISSGRAPWFSRWRSSTMLSILAATMTAYVVPQLIMFSYFGRGTEAGMQAHPILAVTCIIVSIPSMLAYYAQGILWIGWTDHLRRSRPAILAASFAWGTFVVGTSFLEIGPRMQVDLNGMAAVAGLTAAIAVGALYAIFYDLGTWLLRRIREVQAAPSAQ